MKTVRIFSSLLLSLFLFLLSAPILTTVHAESVKQQRNQRQFMVVWKDQRLVGDGYHRPYSKIIVEDDNGDKLWEGNTDARGMFHFVLDQNALSPAREHILVLRSYDQFGREILKDDGNPDILKTTALPGLRTKGKTNPNAEILLVDADGTVLNKYVADDNGNYVIVNAPEGSTLRISKGDEETEIPFEVGEVKEAYVEESEVLTPNTGASSSGNSNTKYTFDNEEKQEILREEGSGSFFISLLGGIFLAIATIGFFIFLKKHKDDY